MPEVESRAIIGLIAIVLVTVVPWQVSRLIEQLSSRSKYAVGSYVGGKATSKVRRSDRLLARTAVHCHMDSCLLPRVTPTASPPD